MTRNARPSRSRGGNEEARALLAGHQPELSVGGTRDHGTDDHVDYAEWVVATLAPGVLALELAACRAALGYTLAFRDLSDIRAEVSLDSVRDGTAQLSCTIDDPRQVGAGTGAEPVDPVTKLAIEIARDVFSVLPIAAAVVNVSAEHLDLESGQLVRETILGARFTEASMTKLQALVRAPAEEMPAFLRRVKASTPPPRRR